MKTKIDKILSHKIVDEVKLRKHVKKTMASCGPEVWSIFLSGGSSKEYYALINLTFPNKNVCYENLLDFIEKENIPFFHKIEIDRKIFHQIEIDIKRLNTCYLNITSQLNTNESNIYQSYINILLLISHRRYNLGYVQGMADFLVPFLCTCPEYQAYFLYLDLIKKVEMNIINLQYNLILRLREEMENIDPVLCDYLHKIGLEFHIFSFRWFNCLFFREFKYKDYLVLFTNILSYKDINSILIFISVGILSVLRSNILKNNYNENVLMIQDISNRKDISVETILKIANKLYKHNKRSMK